MEVEAGRPGPAVTVATEELEEWEEPAAANLASNSLHAGAQSKWSETLWDYQELAAAAA